MGHNYLPEGDVENHKEAAVTKCLHSTTILPLRYIKKRFCLIISKIHRPTEKGTWRKLFSRLRWRCHL